MFMTINTLIILNFDNNLFTNRDLLIKLRDNVFFIVFKFMILVFIYEFLLREFIMLSFSAIFVNVENDLKNVLKNVFDFKFSTIFFQSDYCLFIKKRFQFDKRFNDEFRNFVSHLRFFYEIKLHFDAICQIDFFSFLYLFYNSIFTRCVFDFCIFCIFYVCL